MELNSEYERCKRKLYQFENGIYNEIQDEIDRSNRLHGELPADIFRQLAIMQEEAGEVTKAVLHYVYENGMFEDIHTELVQTAAMCVKMLNHLNLQRAKNDV